MFSGVLSRLVLATAAAMLAAPTVLACENPDDSSVALREFQPTVQEPGEVVLELDWSHMKILKAREETIEDLQWTFDVLYATFDVVRVIDGDFEDKQARINVSLSSTCWSLGGPGARFVVGRPAMDREGIPFIVPRGLTWSELRTQRDQDQKTAH